jgi:hypothetical protein
MAARQWSQSADKSQQANTLAGRHADYILFLLDESGGIPDAVMVTAEAALSSCVEGHIVQAGNPTHLTGPLYRAVTLERAMWKVIEITGDPDDPKRSTRISLQWARDMIKLWGRDHPYVLVNVLGRFPPASFNALIGPDEVRDSQRRFYREFELGNAPKVLGVDVALFGDDQSVVAFRQGLQMMNFKKYRNLQPSQEHQLSHANGRITGLSLPSSTLRGAPEPVGWMVLCSWAKRRSGCNLPARRMKIKGTPIKEPKCILRRLIGSSAAGPCRRTIISWRN